VQADVFKRIFDTVSDKTDMEFVMVYATIVRGHCHGQGVKGGLTIRQLGLYLGSYPEIPPPQWILSKKIMP
jgi:hypothetical protein